MNRHLAYFDFDLRSSCVDWCKQSKYSSAFTFHLHRKYICTNIEIKGISFKPILYAMVI